MAMNRGTTIGELQHSGILGQKWGKRRYQYEDGSLTPAGRERYGVGEAKDKTGAEYDEEVYKDKRISASTRRNEINKNIKNFSSEDLNKIYDRLDKEKKIRELLADEAKSNESAVKKAAKQTLLKVGQSLSGQMLNSIGGALINALGKGVGVVKSDKNQKAPLNKLVDPEKIWDPDKKK